MQLTSGTDGLRSAEDRLIQVGLRSAEGRGS